MADTINSILKIITSTQPVPKVHSNTVLTNATKIKLLSYQEKHVVRLITILLKKYIAQDSSDTGTGKTYGATAVCKELDRKPIIVCPKTLIFIWISVLEYFGVEYYDIVNYETLRNGKTYRDNRFKSRKFAPYLEIADHVPGNHGQYMYNWDVPKDAIIIFDEVHRCKDPSTSNGKLLLSLKQLIDKKIPVLLLSATICEKYTDMKIPFFLYNFIPNTANYNWYIKSIQMKHSKYQFDDKDSDDDNDRIVQENIQALIIYEEIKEFVSRVRIKDLGNKFPNDQVCCQQFLADESDKISEAYDQIAKLLKALKENPGSNHLAKIIKLKQEIEFRKVPIFIEQAQLYLDEGKSVVIFVNFLDTLRVLSSELDIRCKIFGDQTMTERLEAIRLFQSNEERIIICQIRAGGIGISLHDLSGGHPRVSLMNFPDTGTDLLQALGRIRRSGAKSPTLQRIIFVANVEYEKIIMQNINRKLANLSASNDGDFYNYKYDIKKINRKAKK